LSLDPLTAAQVPISTQRSGAQGGHVLGRWTHKRPGGSSLQVQSFINVAARQEPIGEYGRRTFDIDTQYHTSAGAHDLVTGVGYRFNADRYRGGGAFSLTPANDHVSALTAFLQDEIALAGDRLSLSLGTQVQYDTYAGGGLQPNARAMWKLRPGQRLWLAASRALRTPSRHERGIQITFPPVPSESGLPVTLTFAGSPEIRTETFADAEAGYRLEIGGRAGMSATMFVGRYAHLRTVEEGAPLVQFDPVPAILVTSTFGDLLNATTRGFEADGYWSPGRAWRFDASYTALRVISHPAPESRDVQAGVDEGSAPRRQWQIRSTFTPGARTNLSVAVFRVGALRGAEVPAYTRADVNAAWRLSDRLSLMVLGQNLLDPAHQEFADRTSLLLATEVPRSVSVRLRWTFR
jgi:iron complex outermembrane receptor protein